MAEDPTIAKIKKQLEANEKTLKGLREKREKALRNPHQDEVKKFYRLQGFDRSILNYENVISKLKKQLAIKESERKAKPEVKPKVEDKTPTPTPPASPTIPIPEPEPVPIPEPEPEPVGQAKPTKAEQLAGHYCNCSCLDGHACGRWLVNYTYCYQHVG